MSTSAPLSSPDPRSPRVARSAPVAVPTGAPPSSPDPRSSRVVAASAPVAMPSPPPPAPPAADEKRPFPPMKIKMIFPKAIICLRPMPPMKTPLPPPMKTMGPLFPKAISSVFGGMNRASGMALVGALALAGLHAVICIVKIVSFITGPEVAPLWVSCVSLGLAVLLLVTARICYLVSVVKYNAPKKQPAAAVAVLLPPPPQQMDMC